MKIKIVKHQTLYKDNRFHAAFPSIIKLDNGQLLLAFRRARDSNWLLKNDREFDPLASMDHLDSRSHICLIHLNEKLEQISEPRIYPIDPEAADQDPSLLNIGNGKILMSSFSWYPLPGYALKSLYSAEVVERIVKTTGCGYYFWGSHSGLSYDNGQTWDFHHEYLDKTDHWKNGVRERKSAGATRGQCIKLEDELLLASYADGHRVTLWSSLDLGRSWKIKSVIAEGQENGIKFQEPTLYQAPSGKLIAFMRTQGADYKLATAVSHDDGKTWQDSRLHEIKGQPFHALQLNEDKMLLSYGYREEPFGIRCSVVDAECESIDSANEIIVRSDVPCGDCGYPWTVILGKDTLLITYYLSDKSGTRHVDGSILKFNR
jgi:hypothetical protein